MREVVKYGLFFDGESHILGAALNPYKEINKLLDSLDNVVYDDKLFSQRASLRFSTVNTADASRPKQILFGVCFFISTWVGGKVLDEIYHRLKPEIVNFYSNTQSNITVNQNIGIEYRHIMVIDTLDVVIVIRFFANNPSELESLLTKLEDTASKAQVWIEENGKHAEIHEYTFENGNVNLSPNFYDDLSEIGEEDKKKNIKFIKTKINTVK